MNYFSIHTYSGEHLGFLIMLADDESQAQPQSGMLAFKLQSETPPEDQAAAALLTRLEQSPQPLVWRIEKDRVEVFQAQENIGTIRQEYLNLGGKIFVLNDLTGLM